MSAQSPDGHASYMNVYVCTFQVCSGQEIPGGPFTPSDQVSFPLGGAVDPKDWFKISKDVGRVF